MGAFEHRGWTFYPRAFFFLLAVAQENVFLNILDRTDLKTINYKLFKFFTISLTLDLLGKVQQQVDKIFIKFSVMLQDTFFFF